MQRRIVNSVMNNLLLGVSRKEGNARCYEKPVILWNSIHLFNTSFIIQRKSGKETKRELTIMLRQSPSPCDHMMRGT